MPDHLAFSLPPGRSRNSTSWWFFTFQKYIYIYILNQSLNWQVGFPDLGENNSNTWLSASSMQTGETPPHLIRRMNLLNILALTHSAFASSVPKEFPAMMLPMSKFFSALLLLIFNIRVCCDGLCYAVLSLKNLKSLKSSTA